MKKRIAIYLLLVLAFLCAGCGSQPAQTVSAPVPAEASEQAPAEAPAPGSESMPQTEAAEMPAETEAQKRGVNNSIIHVDFMVGSEDLAIDGIRADGSEAPIFRNGTWA